ncbi:hypothetical protein [Brucella pituitosa]|uniref:Uncharacterized protein n=1 Tax=Brucella pituitosa TaxID=571256 RepID=A0A643F8Q6_9HYPH|nr:hypothetical protein [Brucella pituitosa]KAB0573408.1 hypothetical protein F7Q93_02640 [Brucella pituitosa]
MKTYTASQSLYIGARCPASEIELTLTVTAEYEVRQIQADLEGRVLTPLPTATITDVTVWDNKAKVDLPEIIINAIVETDEFDRWLLAEIAEQLEAEAEEKADHQLRLRQEAS